MDDNFNSDGSFKAGNKAGKGYGRPRISQDLRDAKRLSKDEFNRILNRYSNWSLSDLKEYCEDWANPALDILVCRVLLSAIKDGDHNKLSFILDRLIGKPKIQEPDQETDDNIHRKIVTVINQIEQKGKDNGDQKSSEEKSQNNEEEVI